MAEHGEWGNDLVSIDLESGAIQTIAQGLDFYAAPRLSPTWPTLVWPEWHHPNCPGRHGAPHGPGRRGRAPRRAEDHRREPQGLDQPAPVVTRRVLHFASGAHRLDEPVPLRRRADRAAHRPRGRGRLAGLAGSGTRPSSSCPAGRSSSRPAPAVATADRRAADASISTIDLPQLTEISALTWDRDRLIVRAARAGSRRWWRRSRSATRSAFSEPRRPTSRIRRTCRCRATSSSRRPATGRRTATLPADQSVVPRAGGRAAATIVTSHGGPTANAFSGFQTGIQLFTSRGYAVLDVDYGGSTGYGREYRERLIGSGIVDVDDCVAGAKFLAEQGLVDGKRQAIRGGGASGHRPCCPRVHEAVRRRCTYFGIGDLRAFVEGHPQVRVTLPGEPRRALADDEHNTSTGRRPCTPRRSRRRSSCSREPMTRSCRWRRRSGSSMRVRASDPPRLPAVRGRGPRVSRQGRDHPVLRRRAVVLRPGLRVRAGRRHRAAPIRFLDEARARIEAARVTEYEGPSELPGPSFCPETGSPIGSEPQQAIARAPAACLRTGPACAEQWWCRCSGSSVAAAEANRLPRLRRQAGTPIRLSRSDFARR